MSWLSRLFGSGEGGGGPATAVTEYEGFRITPDPIPADGQFRLAAHIERDVNGEIKQHHLIRADLLRDRTAAEEAAVFKAKQMIDQMGVRLFD